MNYFSLFATTGIGSILVLLKARFVHKRLGISLLTTFFKLSTIIPWPKESAIVPMVSTMVPRTEPMLVKSKLHSRVGDGQLDVSDDQVVLHITSSDGVHLDNHMELGITHHNFKWLLSLQNCSCTSEE